MSLFKSFRPVQAARQPALDYQAYYTPQAPARLPDSGAPAQSAAEAALEQMFSYWRG